MKMIYYYLLILLIGTISACRDSETTKVDIEDYSDWSVATHSDSSELNYSVVFNQNKVLRFDIEIDEDDWSNMQSDLAANIGGNMGGAVPMGMPGGPGAPGGPSGPGDIGGPTTIDYDPIWVPCSFKFDDKEWYHVGIRFKGNSSLSSAYQSGNNKLSFKLDFDEYEDDYPELKNQRFYGFKQLNLNSNFDDASLMREKVGADLFREFGLAAAQTTFCVVYLNNGSGPQFYGVYTLVEEVDDTVLDTQFGDDSGNLYKPDGGAASFANGSLNQEQMEKKNNEDVADYSDVEALYNVINSSERTSNTDKWKTDLEVIFNVDVFLKWLAANTVIQNWDTYGIMTHNYFLYNDPSNNQLTWIPWDNNEAFQEGKQGGALSLSLNEVGDSWPLISYLMDDAEYKQKYEEYLLKFVDEVFVPSKLSETYSTYYELLKDYAYAEEAGYSYLRYSSDFDQAVETLKSHAQSRKDAVNIYLGK